MTARRTSVKKYPGIYRSVSGKYEIAYRDGDKRLRFRTVEGDLQDAVAAREEIMGRKRRGEPVGQSKLTFGDYAETWIASLNKRPRTLDSYRYTLNKHLLPRFRARKLAELKTDDVARLVREMSEPSEDRPGGYSAATIDAALTCLSSLYRKAVRAGLVSANPVRGLEPDERPQHDEDDKRILEEEEIARLISAADEQRPLIAPLIFSGLRIAEALGLVWEDVDFAGLHPRREAARPQPRAGAAEDQGIPAQGRARAAVGNDPARAPDGLTLQAVDRPGLHDPGRPRSRPAGGEPLDPGGDRTREAGRRSERAQPPARLRFHADRRVSVAGQLGHAKASTTMNVYAHEFEEARHADELREQFGARYGHLASSS